MLLLLSLDTFASSLLRASRLLKSHCVVRFFFLSDYRTSRPNRLRVLKLVLYLSIAIHWVACLYYIISEYEGLGTNDWVYPKCQGVEGQFTRCYFSYYIPNQWMCIFARSDLLPKLGISCISIYQPSDYLFFSRSDWLLSSGYPLVCKTQWTRAFSTRVLNR